MKTEDSNSSPHEIVDGVTFLTYLPLSKTEDLETMAFELLNYNYFPKAELITRSKVFRDSLSRRRSVRHFSKQAVPMEVVENLVMTAASAPSGANKQPWTFVIIKDLEVKKKIRFAAEEEEKLFYEKRAPEEWLIDLEPLGTDWRKPFLEDAPYLIVVFKKIYGVERDNHFKHYYVNESVGIATGFLLTAIHNAGLVALPHTPSPMGFLAKILKRPRNERAFLLIPVGYPAKGTRVPIISRKNIGEVVEVF